MDDTSFLINLCVFEQQIVAPVVENQQTGIDNTLTFQRSRTNMIDRLVDGCRGIEIGTELYADSLAPRYDAQFLPFARKVLGAVESHVLQKMGQSALTGFFQNAAHTLGNVEVGQSCLLGIVANVVGHTILELPLANGRILWYSLGCCRSRQQHQTYDRQYFFHTLLLFQ